MTVTQATITLGNGDEISVPLAPPAGEADSTFSANRALPFDASQVQLKLHVLLTHLDGSIPFDVPFTLRDHLLLLPRTVLEQLR